MDPRDSSDHHLPPKEETSSKQNRKLRRSCEACRCQKARCLPGGEGEESCLKCKKDGRQCVFLEAKMRPRRVKNSRARVAEMEEKLDGLLALLHARTDGTNVTHMKQVEELTPPEDDQNFTPPNFSAGSEMVSVIACAQAPSSFDIAPRIPMFLFPTLETEIFDDAISKGIIGYSLAEVYLRQYRTHEIEFPFVLVPPDLSLDELRRQRPFLLLSMLIHSAQVDTKLMKALDLEMREMLARRVIVESQKSLDIIQGLLVYLAWHHIFFHPDKDQLYQLAQLAASMATVLCIYKTAPKDRGPDFNVLSHVALKGMMKEPIVDASTLESRRALLGCYYLTSTISQSLRKPYSMKYNDYIGECCSLLSQSSEAKSDYYLQFYVRLQQFADEVNAAFDHDGFNNRPLMDLSKISLLLSEFNSQLKFFHQTFPSEVWDNVRLKISYHNIRIYLNEIGFHARKPLSLLPTLDESAINDWYYSPIRTTALLQTLQATKDLLHLFLTMSSHEIQYITFPECGRLIYALLVLIAFSVRAGDAPNLEHHQVRQMANVEFYANSLITKITIVIQEKIDGMDSPMWLTYLNDIFGILRMNYTKNLLQAASAPASRTTPGTGNWWSTDFVYTSACGSSEEEPANYNAENDVTMNIGDIETWDDGLAGVGWSGNIDPSSLSLPTHV